MSLHNKFISTDRIGMKLKHNFNQNKLAEVDNVRRLFNDMVDEYDHLHDLWYSYTFGEIDKIILREFKPSIRSEPKPIAIDVGCGTGIQSIRLASLGYKVLGIDIAEKLIERARIKLYKARNRDRFLDVDFFIADAQSLPFGDSIADCINCCGPTLNFIPNWRKALSEISRCLRPGGKLLLEVEGKWNLDLFWEIINGIFFNLLKYDETLIEALTHTCPPWDIGHLINYSYKLESGESIRMRLKLFASSELENELQNIGLVHDKRWGLHSLTNIVPSTILHNSQPSHLLIKLFSILSSLERRLSILWPLNAFGCSLLVLAHKQ